MTKLERIRKAFNLRQMLTYKNVIGNLPYVLFLAALAVFYIGNTHWAQKNIRKINEKTEQIKQLRWEYMTTKSDLMYKSKQSQVADEVDTLGLRALRTPPKKIMIEEDQEYGY